MLGRGEPAGFAISAGAAERHEFRRMTGSWDHEAAGIFVEELFAKHHREIYAYLLRMIRDGELAADLAQDAFVKAYKAYDTLEKGENARAWLRGAEGRSFDPPQSGGFGPHGAVTG